MDQGLPSDTKLIFLVGAPRGGTSWLQILLSSAPEVATAPETQLFPWYLSSLFSAWKWHSGEQSIVGLYHVMSETEFLALIREFVSKVMAHILAKKPGATIILEKSPNHVLHWREILRVFPKASFIHLIRDPRSVVASLLAANRDFASHWAPARIANCCSLWNSHVKAGREIAGATPNYIEVRYEALREDGPSSLRSLFNWCGVNVSDSLIERSLREHQIDKLRTKQPDWCTYGQRHNFFRKGEVDSWRADLTAHEIAFVEHMTGDLMAELGYTPVMPSGGIWPSIRRLPLIFSERLRAGISWRLRKYDAVLIRP